MAHSNRTARIILPVIIVLTIIGGSIFLIVHHKNQIKNEKLEARFDRFMGYYYPYLENITKAAEIYKRMQISLMYDYIKYNRGRYIYETVPYYNGGYFSMRDLDNVENILDHADMLYVSRTINPIYEAPKSRYNERYACLSVIYDARDLCKVDIYDENIGINGNAKRTEEVFDSLYIDMMSNFYSLSKYKTTYKKDLNSISDFEFDLNNY